MNSFDQQIRSKALLRLSGIFRIPVEALRPEYQFGVDLKANFVSDFRRNELDLVNDDIHDVADKAISKEMASGRLVIRTVADYCEHMVRCGAVQPKAVETLLNLESHYEA